jgi:pimeloyl-ACP methyl ester carboxylesterase
MAFVTTSDGVKLHVEEEGEGFPILFIHEFAGDHRSWRPQVEAFRARYRCITYDARGYLPSDVPEDPDAYSYVKGRDDAIAVLDGLGAERAHVVGLSMGGFNALQLGIHHPDRVSALVVASAGSGANPDTRAEFQAETEVVAAAFRTYGSEAMARTLGVGPSRVQLQNKNPEAWAAFVQQLGEHSAAGSAFTILGVQRLRPSLWELTDELASIAAPTLILNGDEDDACLEPGLLLKRTIASSALQVLPRTGHAGNLEEPALFNRAVEEFFAAVEAGTWTSRDPRSQGQRMTGGSNAPSP